MAQGIGDYNLHYLVKTLKFRYSEKQKITKSVLKILSCEYIAFLAFPHLLVLSLLSPSFFFLLSVSTDFSVCHNWKSTVSLVINHVLCYRFILLSNPFWKIIIMVELECSIHWIYFFRIYLPFHFFDLCTILFRGNKRQKPQIVIKTVCITIKQKLWHSFQ